MSTAPSAPPAPLHRRRILSTLVRTPRGLFPLIVLGLLVVACLLSFVWLPADPNHSSAYDAWLPPSVEHWLGTDGSGRDLAARLMAGSRVTVLIVLGTGIVAGTVGLILAVFAALGPRWLRESLAILIDVLIAFPTLLLAIMLADTQAYIAAHPIVVLWPGLAITLTVLAFYLLGDALRDAMDPTLRSRGGDA